MVYIDPNPKTSRDVAIAKIRAAFAKKEKTT